MPIYDIECLDCGRTGEQLVIGADDEVTCAHCGSPQTRRLMSASSTLTGRGRQAMPGPGDTACCGSTPGHAGCAGPGSCCGGKGVG